MNNPTTSMKEFTNSNYNLGSGLSFYFRSSSVYSFFLCVFLKHGFIIIDMQLMHATLKRVLLNDNIDWLLFNNNRIWSLTDVVDIELHQKTMLRAVMQ